jgi:hypothetical protein
VKPGVGFVLSGQLPLRKMYMIERLWLLAVLGANLVSGRMPQHESDGESIDVPGLMCHAETGPGSYMHTKLLDELNGRHIAFVGDSVTRCSSSLTPLSRTESLTA